MYKDIKTDDIIKYEGVEFYVLTVFEENSKKYAFMNELAESGEEITGNFYIVEVLPSGELQDVTDKETLDALSPRLQVELDKAFQDVEDDK